MRRWVWCVWAGILLGWTGTVQAGDPWRGQWIWDAPRANLDPQPVATRYFRKVVTLDSGANQDHTLVLVDDQFRLYVNGSEVLKSSKPWPAAETDLSKKLHSGRNILAIEATNTQGVAGLYYESDLKNKRGELVNIVSDASWRVSDTAGSDWKSLDYDDTKWKTAVVLGGMGIPPWGSEGKPGDASAQPISNKPLPASESIKLFTVAPGFEVRLIAEEPDVINPVAMAIDDKGRLFVAESHTYRWGKEGTPVKPPTNPVVMLEVGPDGRAHRKTVVAQGYEDPVMGLAIRDGKIFISALNQLLVADLNPDGTAGPQKLLIEDKAKPWNPFGFFRVAFGPDGWLYLISGDHEIELTGADGAKVKTRGPTGALVRCRPDGTGLELLAQGMRAPFSFDFDPFDHIWILSNGEGNPNRLLMMVPSLDYHYRTRHGDWAWLAGTNPWSPPVTEMERGANTQVSCYLDAAFPAKYWGSLFVANWGAHGFASVNHKIDLYTPDERGNISDVSVFLDGKDPMFRPTQLLPDKDGNLYMLDWYGRDDENDLTGRIYKIVSTGQEPTSRPAELQVSAPPGTVLTDGQVRTIRALVSPHSWERERGTEQIVSANEPAVMSALSMMLAGHPDSFTTSRFLWVLRRVGTPVAMDVIGYTTSHPDPRIRAMCVRLLRSMNASDLDRRLTALAKDTDPEVTVEIALSHKESQKVVEGLLAALHAGAGKDRRLRYQCAAELSRRIAAEQFLAMIKDPSGRETLTLAGWIALDVALLEATNPAARTAFDTLLQNPGPYAADILAQADRWATAQDVPALQKLLKDQITSGQSASNIAAVLNILRRLGPDALTSLPADALTLFFESAAAGKIELPAPADRIAALKLLEGTEAGKAGPQFIRSMLSDADESVRFQALRTVRSVGWQHPELFEAVWARLASPTLTENERLTAIVTLGSQENPPVEQWKTLVISDGPIARSALRACKQFAGNESIGGMLTQITSGLVEKRPELRSELSAVLNLFVDENKAKSIGLPPPIRSEKPDEIQQEMLQRLATSNPRLGQDVFERAGCVACHDVSGATQTFGPALRDIGKAATPASLAESILFPSRTIKDGFEMQFVRTKNGQELEGWIEQHGNEIVVVRGGTERIRLKADEIIERRKLDKSPMPEMALDGVSIDELSDLLAYLVAQGGSPKASASTHPAAAPRASARRPRKRP